MKLFLKKIVVKVLILEARLALVRRRPRIAAITGSVGKTSTKDAVACALAPFFSVRKSEKSYNSDFGVPLTILGLTNAVGNPFLWVWNIMVGATRALWPEKKLDWLVLEVGAGEPGDVKKFAGMLSPDIAVITCFPDVPVHVEFFASPEAVIVEKTELVRAVREGGMLILNADDEKTRSLKSAFPNRRAVLFGTSADADLPAVPADAGQAGARGTDYNVLYEVGLPVGISFRVLVGAQSFAVTLQGVLGRHVMQSVLAAFAVAHALGLDLARVAEAFKHFAASPGRMRLIEGLSGSLIIDDSYNASPVAMREALATFASLEIRGWPASPAGRKIAVLGGMAELGAFSAEEHRKAVELAVRSCEKLIVVGELWKAMGSPAQIHYVETSREAADALARDIRAGDVVLVKGSQSARMERVVKALMREPERAKELLVRQEEEWRDK